MTVQVSPWLVELYKLFWKDLKTELILTLEVDKNMFLFLHQFYFKLLTKNIHFVLKNFYKYFRNVLEMKIDKNKQIYM